jgi:precorrin-6A/cobalt-precorrin-6A reductase
MLLCQGHQVITSMAGVTAEALKPPGSVRIGGFGGAEGLADFLRKNRIDAVADASHPFAARISEHACAATCALGLDLVRLERPAWMPEAGDCWKRVSNYHEAADALLDNAVALLTVGRRGLEPFFNRIDVSGVARMIGVPDRALPEQWLLLIARPPLRVEREMALMREHRITVAVAKNSGGEATAAKLKAARMLGLPTIMIERPQKPLAKIAATASEAVSLLA